MKQNKNINYWTIILQNMKSSLLPKSVPLAFVKLWPQRHIFVCFITRNICFKPLRDHLFNLRGRGPGGAMVFFGVKIFVFATSCHIIFLPMSETEILFPSNLLAEKIVKTKNPYSSESSHTPFKLNIDHLIFYLRFVQKTCTDNAGHVANIKYKCTVSGVPRVKFMCTQNLGRSPSSERRRRVFFAGGLGAA